MSWSAPRGLQVARGGEDRVDRVVRVLAAVVVGVDAVALPGRGHELHPAHGAGGRDVEVAPVVGLDLVDRGEDLPAHAVLDAGGLVDREQEGRDAELLDEEVRHADRRRTGERDGERRVAERRLAVGLRRPGRPSPCRRVLGLLRRALASGSIDRSLSLAAELAGGQLLGLQPASALRSAWRSRPARCPGCCCRRGRRDAAVVAGAGAVALAAVGVDLHLDGGWVGVGAGAGCRA